MAPSSENLEETIRCIESARNNLSAEIVLKTEVGHFEDIPRHDYYPRPHPQYMIYSPQKSAPNIERRELARQELQKIFYSTNYMTARVRAGGILLRDSLSRIASRLISNIKNYMDRFFDSHQ